MSRFNLLNDEDSDSDAGRTISDIKQETRQDARQETKQQEVRRRTQHWSGGRERQSSWQ